MNLIKSARFNETLEVQLSSASSVKILSAYITDSAVNTHKESLRSNGNTTIVARAIPQDFLAGSSTISAFESLLDMGVDLRIHPLLHAKLYLINESIMFLGSANFTNNGLSISGKGNLELMTKVTADEEDRLIVNSIIAESIPLTRTMLEKMKELLSDITLELTKYNLTCWPEDMLEQSTELWMKDFPLLNPLEDIDDDFKTTHDEQLFNCESSGLTKTIIKNSKVFQWLMTSLEEHHDKCFYFGELSTAIQQALQDDPRPYRTDVKVLTQNLLAYCQVYLTEEVLVDRPRYSQRIKLLH